MTTSSARTTSAWSAIAMPPPGALWPAMVIRGSRMTRSEASRIVPATSKTIVRGPARLDRGAQAAGAAVGESGDAQHRAAPPARGEAPRAFRAGKGEGLGGRPGPRTRPKREEGAAQRPPLRPRI